jgi:hypothetical protein
VPDPGDVQLGTRDTRKQAQAAAAAWAKVIFDLGLATMYGAYAARGGTVNGHRLWAIYVGKHNGEKVTAEERAAFLQTQWLAGQGDFR